MNHSRVSIGLVAAVSLIAAEALRASGPLLDGVVTGTGLVAGAVTAVLVYLAPAVVAAVLVAAIGARRATLLAALLLAVLRLVMQQVPTLEVGAVTVAVAVAALVLVVRQVAYHRDGATPAVTGLVLGGAIDVGIRTLLSTWDPVWRADLIGWPVAVVECVALVWLVFAARPTIHPDPYPVGRVGVLGGYLALSVLMFGSPAYVAAVTGLSLPFASAVLLVGALFAVEALSRSALPGGSARWRDLSGRYAGGIAAGVLVVAVTVALLVQGIVAAIAVVAMQVAAALVLARALARSTPDRPMPVMWTDPGEREAAEKLDAGLVPDEEDAFRELTVSHRPRGRCALAFGSSTLAAGLGYVAVVLLYQVHYEAPLPVPNQVVPILAAVVLALLGLGEGAWSAMPAGEEPTPAEASGDRAAERAAKRGRLAPLAVVPAVLLLAPTAMLATSPAPATPPASGDANVGSFRLVSWNVRYLRDPNGRMDPEAVAKVIEEQKPDVVLLQEVPRGWPISGGVDGVEWLSRRLAMPYVYAPAADQQFGNLILSRLRITDVETRTLPKGNGSMNRSYAAATVELPNGRTVRLYDVHLAHRDNQTPTRLAQLEVLLDARAEHTPAVVAGDFNSGPGSQEITKVIGTGLVSAQDTTGYGGAATSPTDRPTHRIDWIFGTPDVAFTDFALLRTQTSDHFPLAVTVSIG